MQRVAVIGASSNPERYANKAMRMLAEYGHEPLLVAPAVAEIEGRPVVAGPAQLQGKVDTVTLYVGPARQTAALIDAIIGLHPQRVIFNPGTENDEASARFDAAGIDCLEACTLVLLRTGQF